MRRPTYLIGLGMLFLFMGLGMSIRDTHPVMGVATMTFGLIYILRGVQIRRFGEDAVRPDERTRKIGAWAASYSWFLTLFMMTIVYWLSHLKIMSLKLEGVLGFLILFMTFSLIFFRWIISSRGDV